MKRNVIALLLVCAVAVMAQQPNKQAAWEYKLESGVSEKTLNARAAEGWEIAATGNFNGGMPYVILKRSK